MPSPVVLAEYIAMTGAGLAVAVVLVGFALSLFLGPDEPAKGPRRKT